MTTPAPTGIELRRFAVCPECRVMFDLADEDEAAEWFYGHDCELPPMRPQAYDPDDPVDGERCAHPRLPLCANDCCQIGTHCPDCSDLLLGYYCECEDE